MNRKKLALLLLCNTVLLVALYFVLVELGAWYVTPIYLALATVLGIVFIVYNRGITGRNTTPEMLPDTMTRDEKLAFIKESKERMNRSRWMLTLIVPLVAALLLDILYLFIFPYVEALFA